MAYMTNTATTTRPHGPIVFLCDGCDETVAISDLAWEGEDGQEWCRECNEHYGDLAAERAAERRAEYRAGY